MRCDSLVAAGIGIATILGVVAYAGCGGDSSAPPEVESTAGSDGDDNGDDGTGGSSDDGSGGTAGSSDDNGSSSEGGADNGTEPAEGGAGGEASTASDLCSRTPVPNEQITDFAIWDAGKWGDQTATLTGGSFTYYNESDETAEDITVTVTDEAANVTGTVKSYAGFGLWFGPCSDASAYAGVSFTISGNVEAGKFQVQTSKNYPRASDKGECEGDWSDPCTNASADIATTDTPETVEVMWEEFAGGVPDDAVDPRELLGIQWEFNCEDCEIDIIIDDVQFIVE